MRISDWSSDVCSSDRLTDAHPDVIAVKSQIAVLKARAERDGNGGGGGNAQNPAYASLAAMRAERQATVSALGSRKAPLTGDIARITSQPIQNPGVEAVYDRSEAHTSELQSIMHTSDAVFCWKKTTN